MQELIYEATDQRAARRPQILKCNANACDEGVKDLKEELVAIINNSTPS